MEYYSQYLKYKNKYLKLKNYQRGGVNTISFEDPLDKPYESFTHLHTTLTFIETNFDLKGMRDGTTEQITIPKIPNIVNTAQTTYKMISYIELNDFEKSKIENNGRNILHIEAISTYSRNNNNLYTRISDKHKVFNCERKFGEYNYKLQIICELSSFTDDSKRKTLDDKPCDYLLTITNETNSVSFTFLGKIVIGKKLSIQKINNINIKKDGSHIEYDRDSIDVFRITPFNFQESYDRLKKTINYCPESTILYKQLYNNFYTNLYFQNTDYAPIITKNFGILMENILINIVNKKRESITKICSTQDLRNNLLRNTMKRINTQFFDGFQIKNKKDKFVDISKTGGHITFDTGNATISIIDEDLVDELKLDKISFFPIVISGVTSDATSNNKLSKYVEVELKLPPNIETIPDKVYKIKAYVKTKEVGNLSKQLLLGQSALGLKLFFDDSYCIGYNDTRQKYEANILLHKTKLEDLDLKEQSKPIFDDTKVEYNNYSKLETIIETLITLKSLSSIIIDDQDSYTKLNDLYTKYRNIFDNKDQIIINIQGLLVSVKSNPSHTIRVMRIPILEKILQLIKEL